MLIHACGFTCLIKTLSKIASVRKKKTCQGKIRSVRGLTVWQLLGNINICADLPYMMCMCVCVLTEYTFQAITDYTTKLNFPFSQRNVASQKADVSIWSTSYYLYKYMHKLTINAPVYCFFCLFVLTQFSFKNDLKIPQ